MTSTYKSQISTIVDASNSTLIAPSSSGNPAQYLRNDGSNNSSWQTISGNNAAPGSCKNMIFSRRVKGLTNNTMSTLMIERASVLYGESLLSGNPNGDLLYYDAVTIPSGFDGIWVFDTSGWICGGSGEAGYIMTVTRPGPTIVYNQWIATSQNDCGTGSTMQFWNGFLAGDVVTFQVNENTGGGTTLSITNSTAQSYGYFSAIWYSTNTLWRTLNYLSSSQTLYMTGTASQSTNTITGTGTTFTSSMVGGLIVFNTANQYGIITAFNSSTSLTVNTSQSVGSGNYTIYYNGVQFDITGLLTSKQNRITSTSNQLLFGDSSTGLTTLSAPVPSGTVTITLPISSNTTLIGTDTTSTLTNKTLTNPTLNTTSALTHKTVTVNTMTTDTSRTSAAILNTYQVGNISEIIRSSLITPAVTVATGWTSSTSITADIGNGPYARLYITGTGQTLTYTSSVNLTIGVYMITYRIEASSNRGIQLMEYQVDNGSFQTFRTFDAYALVTVPIESFEDYFTVTTSGNPFVFRLTINGKNASSTDYYSVVCDTFAVYKLG